MGYGLQYGIGVIVRDTNGAFINGSSYNTISTSVIEAEGSAVIAGMRFALDNNILNVVVETDCQDLVLSLTGHERNRNWRIFNVCLDYNRYRSFSNLFSSNGSTVKLTARLMLRRSLSKGGCAYENVLILLQLPDDILLADAIPRPPD